MQIAENNSKVLNQIYQPEKGGLGVEITLNGDTVVRGSVKRISLSSVSSSLYGFGRNN